MPVVGLIVNLVVVLMHSNFRSPLKLLICFITVFMIISVHCDNSAIRYRTVFRLNILSFFFFFFKFGAVSELRVRFLAGKTGLNSTLLSVLQ